MTDSEIAPAATPADDCPGDPKIHQVIHADSSETAIAGISGSDRAFLTALLVLLMAGSTIQWIMIVTTPPLPPELVRGAASQRFFSVDVNTGSWIDWMQLEGIGPGLAHRIVADRNQNGPFRSIDDLGRVPGIGAATLDRVRSQLTISHAKQNSEIAAPR
jgi:competence protein ComEA